MLNERDLTFISVFLCKRAGTTAEQWENTLTTSRRNSGTIAKNETESGKL